ncbi:integrase [Azospirillum agricola]|uniref:tyrosine-type recombinase/integrase n=1 Tax=Azospirillum agricola TaxID=1720247 RepID=UPI001AE1B87C|nr:site-specific integrase [Azospirillum agricola]MBP2232867.1 integrase [Azospirillum agricola]
MAKANTGPKLVLFGPDNRYGATPKRGFAEYLYYIRWYEAGSKRERSTGTGNVRDAQQALAAFIGERNRPAAAEESQRCGPAAPHELTVTDMLGFYLQHHAPHAAAPERIRYAIRNLIPWWDGVMVDGVTAGACRRYALESGRAPATIRRELGTLAAAMTWCVTEGRLTQGGIVVLPPVPKDEQPFLNRAQAAKLLLTAWRRRQRWKDGEGRLSYNLHLPLFILIGLYQGARKEAILGLQWQPNTEGGYVDLDRGFIDFNPIGRAQTKKRRARVPIAARLLPWLKVARKATRQFVIECDGQPIRDVKISFRNAAIAAGMQEVHPHTLRHTCVTWLLQDGLDVWQVGGFVGMSPQTVQQVYGHHAPEFMAEAATSRRGKGDAGMKAGMKTIRA